MGYSRFLEDLFDCGRVVVPGVEELSAAELQSGREILSRVDVLARSELAGNPPPLHAEAAEWAAITLYRICQFSVHRDEDPATIERAITPRFADSRDASIHYSVDLSFRYLPDVLRFACGENEEAKRLTESLHQLIAQWPLSSVGLSEPVISDQLPFEDSESLMTLFCDRVINRNDAARLRIPSVRQRVGGSIGMYPELSPQLAEALGDHGDQESTQ